MSSGNEAQGPGHPEATGRAEDQAEDQGEGHRAQEVRDRQGREAASPPREEDPPRGEEADRGRHVRPQEEEQEMMT